MGCSVPSRGWCKAAHGRSGKWKVGGPQNGRQTVTEWKGDRASLLEREETRSDLICHSEKTQSPVIPAAVFSPLPLPPLAVMCHQHARTHTHTYKHTFTASLMLSRSVCTASGVQYYTAIKQVDRSNSGTAARHPAPLSLSFPIYAHAWTIL